METISNLIAKRQESLDKPKSYNESSRNLPAVSQCLSRYGSQVEFMTTFNPDRQVAYCKDIRRCLTGNAPTLKTLAETYGQGGAESWLMVQLSDLSEFCGTKEKMSAKQVEELSRVVCSQFPGLKASEIMLFCLQYKSGKFGRFFGSVDALTVAYSLRQFIAECDKLKRRYYDEDESARRKAAAEASQVKVDEFNAMLRKFDLTPMEYLKHKDLFKSSLTDDEIRQELAKRKI